MANCSLDHVDIRWDGGSVRIAVEVAETPKERGRGLMFRETLGRYSGMLFDYKRPVSANFWMKNTLIPLDMVFVDTQGVVQKIHENAEPRSLKTIRGGRGILAVLEVNGGLTGKLGITTGAQMRHPLFDSFDAKWPCE